MIALTLFDIVLTWLAWREWHHHKASGLFVDLALLEIAECGGGQVQITRRLVALLDDLVPDVPQDRRAALRRHRESLEIGVGHRQLTGRALDVARRGDRQGLGGSG